MQDACLSEVWQRLSDLEFVQRVTNLLKPISEMSTSVKSSELKASTWCIASLQQRILLVVTHLIIRQVKVACRDDSNGS